jgi:hypothetical protein
VHCQHIPCYRSSVVPLGTADRVALALIMLSEAGFGIWLIGRARANQLERLTMQVSDATPITVIIGGSEPDLDHDRKLKEGKTDL